MNEQEQISQLSALFDGELPRDQAGMVIRRALKDSSMRATWGRYALIGACVRGEPIGALPPQADIAARVRARMAAEAEHAGVGTARAEAGAGAAGRGMLLGRGMLGGAIAAGVAVLSLFLFRTVGPVQPAAESLVAQAPAAAALQPAADSREAPVALQVAARDTPPPSYTTPAEETTARRAAPLVKYVAEHADLPASSARFPPLSSVMSGSFELTQDAVEMSDDEVGARR